MDPPDLQTHDPFEHPGGAFEAEVQNPGRGESGDAVESGWLQEIVTRLQADPNECWPAIESLSAVDEETRVRVVAALAAYAERPGVRDLLRLLGSAREPAVRSAAACALTQRSQVANFDGEYPAREGIGPGAPVIGVSTSLLAIPADRAEQDLGRDIHRPSARMARSLVTALDGEGRGTIVLSASDRGYRRTAAFRCDVCLGILDVVGEVEEERPSAGRLIDEWIQQADGDYVLDAPELAVRLLEGCFRLTGPEVPTSIRAWLEATIGPMVVSPGSGAALPGAELRAIPDHEMTRCAERVLDACPAWLDRSVLTYELADEIALREGCATPDPVRDSGAYRYLFEHLLIGRLELYARMLLWMGWAWHADAQHELSRSAFALAAQLSEEQYAVPSHPFTVSLTTRSLSAAQAVLLGIVRSSADE
jgi:hypothetical protein